MGCLGCASKRTIASFESGGRSRSIPENRVVISRIESSTFFNRTDGKYILQIDGRTIDGLISAEGQLTQNEASEKISSELPAELLTQSKIIITKDWSNTRKFFEWRQNVTNGKTERKPVSII